MKKLVSIISAILFMILFTSSVQAVKVAMIVRNANNLSYEYEKTIKDILVNAGHNVTLVDKTTPVNYSDYELIVVAGRPSNAPPLDSFVANIPVNDYPTIAIDSTYVSSWGWATGVSNVFSNQPQSIYIFNTTHPITSGYNETVTVHIIDGKPLLGFDPTNTNSTSLATLNELGNLGIITVADPNTTLANGKTTKRGFVFFGISNSLYWTQEAQDLFKRAVDWSIDSDKDGVHNVKDLCPYTPANASVNSDGCSCSQISCDDGDICTDDTCSAGVCSHTINNLCQNYCNDSIRYYNPICVSPGNCSYTSEDCDSKDSWYNTTQWVSSTQCTEKEQIKGEQRNYSCDPSACLYNVTNTTLTDNGNTRATCINTGTEVINVEVNGSRNLTQNFTGLNPIRFLDSSNNTLIECSFNFSAQALNLSSISINRNENGIGSIAIKGLTCTGTKTVYVNRIAGVNYICIKDADIASISEITSSCNGANETLMTCNTTGSTSNGYSCVLNTTTNRYVVSGLNHSGVKEYATCSDGIQDQGETGVDCGGPCSACPSSSSSLGSGSDLFVPVKDYTPPQRKIQSSGVPTSLNLEKDKNYTFSVSVKNIGDVDLFGIKINTAGIPSSWVSVMPDSETVLLTKEKTFSVTINPSIAGSYNASLDIISGSTKLEEDTLTVKVFDSLSVPKLSMEASPLKIKAGVGNVISIKIKNEGNSTADGNLTLTIPEGWSIDTESQPVSIETGEKSFDFNVTPSLGATGNYSIEAEVSYDALDGTKTVSQPFQLEISEEKLSITSMMTDFFTNSYLILSVSTLLIALLGYLSYSGFRWRSRSSSNPYFIKNGHSLNGNWRATQRYRTTQNKKVTKQQKNRRDGETTLSL